MWVRRLVANWNHSGSWGFLAPPPATVRVDRVVSTPTEFFFNRMLYVNSFVNSEFWRALPTTSLCISARCVYGQLFQKRTRIVWLPVGRVTRISVNSPCVLFSLCHFYYMDIGSLGYRLHYFKDKVNRKMVNIRDCFLYVFILTSHSLD